MTLGRQKPGPASESRTMLQVAKAEGLRALGGRRRGTIALAVAVVEACRVVGMGRGRLPKR